MKGTKTTLGLLCYKFLLAPLLSVLLFFSGNTAIAQTYENIMWGTVASQPFTVNEAQGKVVNGRLYTFGGFDVLKSPNFTPTKRAYVYDPVANTWTPIADLPYTPNGSNFGGVTHAGITTDGTNIFLAGGYTSNTAGTGQIFGSDEAWRYNVATNTYTQLPDLPYATSAAQMEFLNGKLHLIGGTNPARTTDLGDHLVLDLNNLGAGWTNLAPLPNPRHHGGSAVVGGKIYFIGGQHEHDGELVAQNDVHVYDPGTNSWSQVADLPSPAGTTGRGHITSATVVADGKIIVLAGETSHGVSTNMVSLYNPTTDTWENLTPLPANRYSGVAAYMGGHLYYTGGSSTSTTYKGVLVKPGSFKVNFQDNATATPSGWLKDFGQSYGPRTSASQGTGNTYGWVSVNDNTPLDLTAYGRKRSTPTDVLLATLMHMQASPVHGKWEAELANGNYEVTVAVGDGGFVDSRHFINIEGVPAIVDFVPTTAFKFKTARIPVSITDGKLTVDALGGSNTKINYVIAYPVNVSVEESLSFNPGSVDFNVIQNGTTPGQSSVLSASNGTPTVNLTKSVNSSWLILPSNPAAVGSLTFNINSTGLTPGNYSSVVTASAAGYTNATLQVNLTVEQDPNVTTITILPTADAYVRKSEATTNFGNADSLVIKTTPSGSFNRNTFLKFSLQGVQTVSSAKLRVYGKNLENSTTINTSVFGVTNDSWTETGINWNNAPASSGSALSVVGINNQEKYYEFDVTSFVSSQLAGDKVVSLLLTDVAIQEKLISLRSKESSINKPELVIMGTSEQNNLSFTPDSIHFDVIENGTAPDQNATLAATTGTPSVSLSKSANSDWLVLPSTPALGSLAFGINSTGLAPGTYSAIVTASATGYTDAQLEVVLEVSAEIKNLSFTPDSIHFDVIENGTAPDQNATLAATTGTPSVSLSKSANSDWLVLPSTPALGSLAFGINSTGLAPGTYSAIVTASATGYTDAQLEVVLEVSAEIKNLSFTPDSIHFDVIENGTAPDQNVTLAATTGTPSVSLSKSANSDWLVLPSTPALGSLAFGINSTGLAPGTYSAIVTASATGYTDAQLEVVLEVSAEIKNLSFTPDSIHFDVIENSTAPDQNATLAATTGTPSVSLSKSANSDWLVLPSTPALGSLAFGINSTGLAPGTYSAIVTASATGYTDAQLEVVLEVSAEIKNLSFTPDSIHFDVIENGTAPDQNVTLAATTGTPSVSLSKSANSDWLVLPSTPALGSLAFGINSTGLAPGTYSAIVTASATGYTDAQLEVVLEVADDTPPPANSLSFNAATLNFVVLQNETAPSQNSTLSSSSGTPDITLEKSANSDWLVLPVNPVIGTLTFGINSAGLAPGNYSSTVTASSAGYTSGTMQVNLRVDASTPSVITLNPVADAYVRKSVPTTNFGSADSLVIKTTPSGTFNRNTYLKFSLTGIQNVSSAKLRLYGKNIENSATINASVFGITDDSWSEAGITWNNAPGATSGALSVTGVNNVAQYYEFDVTSFVQNELNGDKIITLLVSDVAIQEKLLSFHSRENTNKPELVITDDLAGKNLTFDPDTLEFNVIQNGTAANQNSTLSASLGTPTVTLTKSANSNWLNLPSNTAPGTMSFGISSTGLAPGLYTSTVTASASGYSNGTLIVTLQVTGDPGSASLLFVQNARTLDVEQGNTTAVLEYIAASDSTPVSVQLNAVGSDGNVPNWLTVNGNILEGINYTAGSEITFNADATNLSIGSHTARITASRTGYNSALLDITLNVKAGSTGVLADLMINFQDANTVPPSGWIRDFGQPFGPRTSTNQGTNNIYGWIKRSDGTPLDLTANGRKRNTPSDILLATLMHMQGNHVTNFSGTKVEGIWEAQVANGAYDVTVSVGDGTALDSRHTINVEGVPAILNFVPVSGTLFKNATISVSVSDGLLTIDAIGGQNTKINYVIIKPTTTQRPSVVTVSPENGSQNVSENTSISTLILNLPNGGINNTTITPSSVYLTELGNDSTPIPANVNGTGGGDAITLVPSSPLKLSTTYIFHVTDQVKDLSGASFIPYSSGFTTGAVSTSEIINAKFDKVALPNASGRHSSLTIGPDGKLYALSIDGVIKRFVINADGTLQDPELLYSLQDAYGPRTERLAIGLAFDPSSTSSNLIVYVTHSTFVFLDGPEWDGKLTRLSGPNLQNVQDILINLPRSSKDHLTNSIAFGPDGKLYFTQGSNSAMGRADLTWGQRDESLLSGAVLKLDLQKLGALPLNVKTSDGGTYNPYNANAPLTIHASGVRNAYDLVWHSNGELYVPTNGSAAGGNTPASVNGVLRPDGSTYNGPTVPAITNVQQTQKDFLYRVQPGGYYGHPNPTRGEFVMNGGNPTSAIDPAQIDQYPLGTLPDANYRGFSFDFQMNKSPNGAIEYRSGSFNGALRGKLMVVRYSQHDDIITLTPGTTNKDIISYNEGSSIEGFTGFVDPLDLVEHRSTGNIYVSEYGGDGKITLLKPQVPPSAPIGTIGIDPDTVYMNQTTGGGASAARQITIRNVGDGVLTISSITKSGSQASEFTLSGVPALPVNINPNSSIVIDVTFDPTTTGVRTALLDVASNDTINPIAKVTLRGLGTAGIGGSNEPSLQMILNLYQLPITSGDDDANTNVIHSNTTTQKAPLLGEEVSMQKFVKAGDGNVTIEPLAVFGPTGSDPIVGMGWYLSGNAGSIQQLLSVSNNPTSNGQTVNVSYTGVTSFDPGTETFGFFTRWPFFADRHVYSEDALNTFTGSIPHHVRVYPYKNTSGVLIPNTYLVAFEEHISGFDYQDFVFIVRNVKSGNQVNLVAGPIADANTRNGSFANTNFGLDTLLAVKTNTSTTGLTRSTYLKFSLGGVTDVVSAKLRLYGKNTENNTMVNLSVFGVLNDSWKETEITLNTAPASSGSALGTMAINDQLKYYEVDVTNFVQAQFNGDKTATFLVNDPSNQNRLISFNSRENAANQPQLVITTSSLKPVSGAVMQIENLDRFPSGDLFIASRIHIPWTRDTVEPKTYNKNHDTVRIRIHNKGTNNLVVNNFIRSNTRNWQFLKLKGLDYDSATAFPLIITPGTSADLTVQFVEPSDLGIRVKQFSDHLTILSNDDKEPARNISLYGMWQRMGEGSREPRTQEMITLFGFKSTVGFTATDPDQGDPKKLKGDEIVSSHFVRADLSKPVYVMQMAAYHGCCTQLETIRWYPKTTGTPVLTSILTHLAVDGQTMLPRKFNGSPGDGNFSPTTPFGLKVGGLDFTDTLRNPGRKIGIRVWKAKDANGRIIPNEYIIANDYLGTEFTNYDYNDNLYYIKNIRPEFGTPNFSTLGATPSAVDFDEKQTGSSTQLTVNLQNLGTSYSDGSVDPQIQISSVQIVGENSTEFSADLPALTALNAQQTTTLNVRFNPVSQGLKIADLLIHYNFGKPLRIPLYGIAKNEGVTVNVHNRIKSGSTTSVTVNGKVWSAESGFAFDNLEPYANAQLSSIASTDEDILYLREQSSNGEKKPFRYAIPIANGNYVVRLHFAEIFWGVTGGNVNGGPGSRIMSVALENTLRLVNLDVAAEVGSAAALVKNIPVTVNDGQLDINFTAALNRPMVCAVEVYSFSSPSASITSPALVSITETTGPNNFEKPVIYPNPVKNRFNIKFPTTYYGDLHLAISDVRGRKYVLGKYSLNPGGSNMEVDISKLTLRPGVYFLTMTYQNRKTEVVKLIVQ